jgi:uncharacterized membrane protein
MAYSTLLAIHICGALIGLLFGWVAMFFRKGSRRHGFAGNVFFVSMLSMTTSAVCIAAMKHEPSNAMAGVLTFYLVATAWLTVRRKPGETGRLEIAATFLALGAGIAAMFLGWQASHSTAPADGALKVAYFVFGFVALLSVILDVKMFASGGVFGAMRIARHLWRMCFALLITTLSALSGKRTAFLPEALRKPYFLALPIVALLLLMIFWLCRVLFTNKYKKKTVAPRIVANSVRPVVQGGTI